MYKLITVQIYYWNVNLYLKDLATCIYLEVLCIFYANFVDNI
jgi:hypothetical protein